MTTSSPCFLLSLLASVTIAAAGCSRSISPKEAAQHIGQRCTVEGFVASAGATRRGTVFLDFDNGYPHQTFTAVSLNGELSAGDLVQFVHHTVRVTGTVATYNGRPEIVLHSLSQISIVK